MNLRSASVSPRADVKTPSAARQPTPEARELTGPQPTAAAPATETAPKRRGRINMRHGRSRLIITSHFVAGYLYPLAEGKPSKGLAGLIE